MDKMSFYTQFYKHKPNDVVSREDETLWRRQTPKLLYPLGESLHFFLPVSYLLVNINHVLGRCLCSGAGQAKLWMPQGVLGQVMMGGKQGYLVRWEFSYSSWTLFTCEVEMLLHVVSTAGRSQILHIFIWE